MCLIFISLDHHPKYKLIIAANRDEFYNRSTLPAHFWKDRPEILGGRDLQEMGTWMGVSKSGKISMVTNYRDLAGLKSNTPSRGHLVSDYLSNGKSPDEYLKQLQPTAQLYNGFNLLVGYADELWYLSNYKTGIEKIKPGFYGISNHLLETPWPKVVRGKELIKPALTKNDVDANEVLDILLDEQKAADDQLPKTGLDYEREKAVSSMFIKSPNYGSRSSTIVLIDGDGNVSFTERVYDLKTFDYSTRTFQFQISE
ncbi:MAG: NRDE family protein [Flammeovirgaceae bacterium]|nr:NRDE family protein [Flammeovirgaceae bacterium]